MNSYLFLLFKTYNHVMTVPYRFRQVWGYGQQFLLW